MTAGFHLTLLLGLVPAPAPAEAVEALQTAQVTVSTTGRSGFQLTFAVSRRSVLAQRLLPAKLFDPPNRVILAVTVNGTPTVLIDGAITRQEMAPSNLPGQSKLTVTGEDLSVYMDAVDLTGVPYAGTPVAVRVAAILAKYAFLGVVPLPVPPLMVDVPNPLEWNPVQEGTDLAYLQKMAREVGYVFYVEPGLVPGTSVGYFGPEVRVGVPQPALTVDSDAHSNVEALTVSLDGLSSRTMVVLVQEPKTKAIIPVPLPSATLLKPPLAAIPTRPHKVDRLRNASRLNLLRAALLGVGEAAASADTVTATGSLNVLRYGHVLRARGLVGVRGAGLPYDGLYYVKGVTHHLQRGEYKQDFTLVRGGLMPLGDRVLP